MKRFFALILASCSVGTFAAADFMKGNQAIALYGGVGSSASQYDYHPGDRQSVSGPGPAFGGQYLYYIRTMPSIAVGGDVLSALGGNRHNSDLLSGFDSTARLKSLVGMGIVRLAYPHGEIRPYIFAGAGVHHSSQELSAQPLSGVTWANGGTDSRVLVDDHKTSAALGYGIGLDLFPAQSFFIGTELRAVWLAGLNTGDNAALRAQGFTADEKRGVTQSYVLMHLGWMFR
jgi:hypothetical protein